ncbi:MAG: carboxypeptidase regulatory-like domain-containing protein [Candidatus Solibacter sp.]
MGAVLAGAIILAGCGGDKPAETAKTEATAPAAAGGGTATPDEANGGTVTGKIAFTGDKPKIATIDMSAQPVCERQHKGEAVKSEEVVINGNGTLKNVFVWVKSGLPADTQWAVPAVATELDQSGCMYKPRVIGLMAGQNFQIKNADPANHNIHPQPQVNPDWNESQSPGQPPLTKSFARQEVMIPVKCNVHPWMRAYIGVVGHPFFAVTGDDGSFTIKGLPPGTYVIQSVHEKYGLMEQTVTVGAKESKTVEFSYKG